MGQLASVGPKPVIRGKQAVCSSSQPIVTDTMLQMMRSGGNAAERGDRRKPGASSS